MIEFQRRRVTKTKNLETMSNKPPISSSRWIHFDFDLTNPDEDLRSTTCAVDFVWNRSNAELLKPTAFPFFFSGLNSKEEVDASSFTSSITRFSYPGLASRSGDLRGWCFAEPMCIGVIHILLKIRLPEIMKRMRLHRRRRSEWDFKGRIINYTHYTCHILTNTMIWLCY